MSTLWSLAGAQPPSRNFATGATLPTMFWDAVSQRQDKVWMREKLRGFWREWSWERAGVTVREIACGLMSLEVQPGDVCSILANTSVKWLLADLGVLSAGGVTNGIYPTDSGAQVEYLCADSSTTVLFAENDEQLDKVLDSRSRLPKLRWIVVLEMEGLHAFSDNRVISLDELLRSGQAYASAQPMGLQLRLQSRSAKDLAILVYTSGTTGRPKGVMHSHHSLIYSLRRFDNVLPQGETDDRMCFLPLCHLAERLLGAYQSIYTGARLNFAENPDTVPENLREIAPTVFFAVPRIWEKLYSSVVISVQEATRLQQLVYEWAVETGGKVADCVIAGQAVPATLKLKFMLAQWSCLANVRRMIGVDRARWLFTGSAPIAPDLIRWYLSLGVPMLEGWAQSECLLGTSTRPDYIRPGTIGKPIDGVEVRVDAETGELMLRGPCVFMGYLNQPERTLETIDGDGWLHTGDIGVKDAEGCFRITDRLKDIIITAGGKNVTPSEWENELKFSPYITDAIVIGDRRPYLSAIVMIDHENVERIAQERGVPFSDYRSLARAPAVIELIHSEIERVNRKFARVEQVKKFVLLETKLSTEDEELTPTMKLKRKLVERKYADRIEAMYQ